MSKIDNKEIPDLIVENQNGILTVIINRPATLNALNLSVFSQLLYVLETVINNDEVACLLISGAGPKAFVAGADIQEFTTMAAGTASQFLSLGNEVMTFIENFPKPIIAVVNGFALGGGCELAMACHIRMASENAKFGLPEINLGLIPGYGGTQRLPRIAGKGIAYEMMFTGEMIDAPKALEYRLINSIWKPEELMLKAKEFAMKIISKPKASLANIIKAVNASDGDLQVGIGIEGKLFTACTLTEDFNEGINAFLEKRKPIFKRV